MTRERNAFKAGLFIVLSFVTTLAVLVLIRGQTAGPTQDRSVTFSLEDDISGLNVGDEVRMGGAKIGSVVRIEFLSGDAPTIKVTFRIPKEFKLHEGAKIAIEAPLTGAANLNIMSLGVRTATEISEQESIKGTPDNFKVLLASLRGLTPHVQAIAEKVEKVTLPAVNDAVATTNGLVSDARTLLSDNKDNVKAAVKSASETMAQASKLLSDNKENVGVAIQNLRNATDKVNKLLEQIDAEIPDIKAAFKTGEKAVADVGAVAAQVRSILADNRPRVDAIIKELKIASDNLKAAVVEVRHSPWRIFHVPNPDEMANLNIYDSARQFAEGAGNLSDAAMALRGAIDAMNNSKDSKDVVTPAQLQKLLEHLDQTFKKFQESENKLWTAVKQ